jgi:zinc finger BED domain-containing protein 5/7/8/9
MSKTKKVCRQYSIDYLKFGFIAAPHDERLPLCLVCGATFSNEAMKPSRLMQHLEKIHLDKKDKPLSFFKSLKDDFGKRKTIPTMFSALNKNMDDNVLASFNMSLLIAKTGKSHDIGERLIIPCIKEYLSTVLKKPSTMVRHIIRTSNNYSIFTGIVLM